MKKYEIISTRTYETFIRELCGTMRKIFPDVRLKVENLHDGQCCIPDGMIVAYLGDISMGSEGNELYVRYLTGTHVEEICESISRDIISLQSQTTFLDTLEDYEQVKEYLFPRVENMKSVQKMLPMIPFHMVAGTDMVITYHVIYNDYDMSSDVTIQNSMLDKYGIDREQLRTDAFTHAEKVNPVIFQSYPVPEGVEEYDAPLIVRTLENEHYGAVALFYDEVLPSLHSHYEGDMYVIPNSVDEFLIAPCNSEYSQTILEAWEQADIKTEYPDLWLSDTAGKYPEEI